MFVEHWTANQLGRSAIENKMFVRGKISLGLSSADLDCRIKLLKLSIYDVHSRSE
jgi:hypothetical protein